MHTILDFLKNKYFKFGIAVTIYILWVIWLGNYWFILGIPVIYDMYVTKKVNWSPWKKRNQKNHVLIEWFDALLFAVVAVTIINTFLFQNYKIPTGSMERTLLIGDHLYVSKVSFGPRIPNTPLSVPFTQNMLWGTTQSFSTLIQWPYKRLKGLSEVQRDDIVVFNYPDGDTVALELPSNLGYYTVIRNLIDQQKMIDAQSGIKRSDKEYYGMARKEIWDKYTVVYRPIDKTDNYVKRCVAVGGDTLTVVNGEVYINGKHQKQLDGKQFRYEVNTSMPFNPKILEDMDISTKEIEYAEGKQYMILTDENLAKLKTFKNVTSISSTFIQKGLYDPGVFPHNPRYPWNQDNLGPMYIPKKGATTKINLDNLCFYERIIGHFENNKLEVKDSTIYINDKPATEYTFKMNYYFMMGDNRHNSLDARFWGYVPEDHIIGRPIFIWLSLNENKSFPANIRWNRMFRSAKN